MNSYVLDFNDVDKTDIKIVGGKGANLGELSKIESVRVPTGFFVTTEAYKKATDNNEELNLLLNRLSLLKADDRENIREISSKIRKLIEDIPIPKDVAKAVTYRLKQIGEQEFYAVRSSATAEDLPTASFAGQQDTYLNITGKEAVLKHISKCWASLFTDRAVVYRLQNSFSHNKVFLSVIIQKMIFPKHQAICLQPIRYDEQKCDFH